jgi:hypothetical protein
MNLGIWNLLLWLKFANKLFDRIFILSLKLTCTQTQVSVRYFKANLPLQRSPFVMMRGENHRFQPNVAGV